MWFFAYVLLPLAVLICLALAFGRIRHLKLKRAALTELAGAYAAHSEQPRLELSYLYGYPAFTVIFRNHALLQSAMESGSNTTFTRAIATLCKGHGSKNRPFDAELAVSFQHENIVTRADLGIQ